MPPQQPLRVVVLLDRAPHSYKEGDEYKGLYVELWKEIAAERRLPYTFYGESDTGAAVAAVSSGRYDVGCGSFSIQGDWIGEVDFCRPIEICAVNVFRGSSSTYATRVMNKKSAIVFACIIVLYLFFFVLYRVVDPTIPTADIFCASFIRFLGKSGLAAYDGGATIGTKIIDVFFALFGFVFTTYLVVILIGGFFTTGTAYLDPSGIREVGVLKGSVYEHYAKEKGYKTSVFSTQKELFASGLDVLTLPFFVKAYGGGKNYVSCRDPLFFDERSFIVNYKRNDLVRLINQTIVGMRQNGKVLSLCHRYLGGDDTSCRIQGRVKT
jgi:ABC-type amino acid transport substrate-binding protein